MDGTRLGIVSGSRALPEVVQRQTARTIGRRGGGALPLSATSLNSCLGPNLSVID